MTTMKIYTNFYQAWCIVHHAEIPQGQTHCVWDLWAGPRPGRGECKEVEARVEIRYEDMGRQ